MKYQECLAQAKLEYGVLYHHTYKGSKLNGFYIVPEIGNVRNMIHQSILGKFNLAMYLDLPLNIYAVYNQVELNENEVTLDYEQLDVVVDNLDDNS
jgi:hypothetical protein